MTQTEGQIVLIQFFTELVNVKADTVTVLCRWEYEEVGCVGVSVWPQSGQADPSVVASLQVRLVSDQERREVLSLKQLCEDFTIKEKAPGRKGLLALSHLRHY